MHKNELRRKRYLKLTIFFISIFLFSAIILLTQFENKVSAISVEPSQEQILRFGITLPYLTGDYVNLVNQINAKAVLDWRTDDNNEWAEHNIDYLHVIRVSDAAYDNGALLDKITGWVTDNPGEVWIIGNEPDRFCYQDSINPEVYAQRFYDIAIRIRHFDPTAKIGFGSVVQPTPIRIRYLERAVHHLTYLSCGNRQAALDLIDFWSIHAFLLNEEPYGWGADIPVGFFTYDEEQLIDVNQGHCYSGEIYPIDISDAIKITNFSDTYSIDKFEERIVEFRKWMNLIGEKDKPLWITEYGSLFPPIDLPEPPNYVTLPDSVTSDFMIDTFEFLLSSTDQTTGYTADNNHLVQRWFWYSLNEFRYVFGGTLFDPDKNFDITLVGENYQSFTNEILQNSTTGISPVIYRQDNSINQPYFDELSQKFSYPYEFCFRSQFPLVFK